MNMKEGERKLVTTADGSDTLYHSELDEHYHSIHGAIQESMHVFIKHGLQYASVKQKTLDVLEVGLGTGLNALLTYIQTHTADIQLSYAALEAYPLTLENALRLNYPQELKLDAANDFLTVIHSMKWNEEEEVSERFKFQKIQERIEDFQPKKKYDLIYFDAFGPRVQPELWEQDIMDKAYNLLKPFGILVTYCAKGVVKRRLKAAGFEVTSLPGPPGKREMTRGRKVIQ